MNTATSETTDNTREKPPARATRLCEEGRLSIAGYVDATALYYEYRGRVQDLLARHDLRWSRFLESPKVELRRSPAAAREFAELWRGYVAERDEIEQRGEPGWYIANGGWVYRSTWRRPR